MSKTFFPRAVSVLFGFVSSLCCAATYPILTGGFVFHHYPAWPRPLAAAYVVGGILLQAWFCLRPGRPSGARLLTQLGAGILFVAALALLPGSIIMT